MVSPTVIALTGFIAWALFLLILMEVLRSRLVIAKQLASNEFRPDNANLSPFMQRLARAHANCVENLPIFGGLLLVALVTGQTGVTDALAYVFLVARIAQSSAHLASLSVLAVNIRFLFFAIQLVIGAYWAVGLLLALLG